MAFSSFQGTSLSFNMYLCSYTKQRVPATPACYPFLTVTDGLHYPSVMTRTTILRILFPLGLDYFLGCRYPPPVPVGPRSHIASTSFASNGAGTMVSLDSIHLLPGPFKHLRQSRSIVKLLEAGSIVRIAVAVRTVDVD